MQPMRKQASVFCAALLLTISGCSSGGGKASSPGAESGATSGGTSGTSGGGSGTSGGTSGTSGGTSSATSASSGKVRIALLLAGLSNGGSAAVLKSAKSEAAKEGAGLDVFDGNFDPQKQFSQFQDVITTRKYQAILIQPLDGASICSLVSRAVGAKIRVGAVNSAIGTNFTSSESNCPGVDLSVVHSFTSYGRATGELTVQACATLKVSSCKVGFLHVKTGVPFDTAILKAFQQAINSHSEIRIVANADSMASRQGGFTAIQQILAAHPDISVLTGAEQSLLGGQPALESAHLNHKVLLTGIGGSFEGVAAVKAGKMFGVAAGTPGVEGEIAVRDIIKIVQTGKPLGGVDAVALSGVPDGGLITAANVDKFTPDFHV